MIKRRKRKTFSAVCKYAIIKNDDDWKGLCKVCMFNKYFLAVAMTKLKVTFPAFHLKPLLSLKLQKHTLQEQILALAYSCFHSYQDYDGETSHLLSRFSTLLVMPSARRDMFNHAKISLM